METKANYVLIGVFVLAIIAGVFGFVFWFQNGGTGGERSFYRVVFENSVSGLRTGASVLFNGIRVGEVNDLRLNPEQPKQVVAYISVEKSVAIRPDTRVAIEFQGLTGIAAIGLSGGSVDKPPLVGTKDNPATLNGSQGLTQDVTQGARDVLRRIDDFITENREPFNNTLKNLESFSGSLAKNSVQIDETLKNIEEFSAVMKKNGEKIDHIMSNLETLTGGPDGNSGEIVETVKTIRELATNLDKRTATITDGVNKLTATGTRQIDSIGREFRQTLNTIERAARNIDQNPSRLLFGGSGGSSNQNRR
jgi:phospholipid/cholesterol/gamma-HCH transport system substrate-binding protein